MLISIVLTHLSFVGGPHCRKGTPQKSPFFSMNTNNCTTVWVLLSLLTNLMQLFAAAACPCLLFIIFRELQRAGTGVLRSDCETRGIASSCFTVSITIIDFFLIIIIF